MPITLDTLARPSPDVLFQNLDGEAVLLDLASESYFGLNAVGTRVWELLGQDPDVQRAFEHMRVEYNVEHEQLQSDLLCLIEDLANAGLVSLQQK